MGIKTIGQSLVAKLGWAPKQASSSSLLLKKWLVTTKMCSKQYRQLELDMGRCRNAHAAFLRTGLSDVTARRWRVFNSQLLTLQSDLRITYSKASVADGDGVKRERLFSKLAKIEANCAILAGTNNRFVDQINDDHSLWRANCPKDGREVFALNKFELNTPQLEFLATEQKALGKLKMRCEVLKSGFSRIGQPSQCLLSWWDSLKDEVRTCRDQLAYDSEFVSEKWLKQELNVLDDAYTCLIENMARFSDENEELFQSDN
ncbi:hypothetical protein [Pseudomonas typographi]|uniref:hypothetical protein n=1 Tax=Pseudomonas typographi TaxID=2715964 RepID=UPI0016887BFF|nr:hypothetical protein [Pseudomonas typographi]MBD1552912.1 hypothetical protein [Pseudomonas typographi]